MLERLFSLELNSNHYFKRDCTSEVLQLNQSKYNQIVTNFNKFANN